MNTAIIVAIITAISTTVPQLISTNMKNKQELAIKKLEYSELIKKNVITEFIIAVSNCMDNGSGLAPVQSKEYYKRLNILLTYFPNINQESIDNLTKSIYSNDKTIQKSLMPVIQELSKLLYEIE